MLETRRDKCCSGGASAVVAPHALWAIPLGRSSLLASTQTKDSASSDSR